MSETTGGAWTRTHVAGYLAAGVVLSPRGSRRRCAHIEPLIDMNLDANRGVWTANVAASCSAQACTRSFRRLPLSSHSCPRAPLGFRKASVSSRGLYLLPSTIGRCSSPGSPLVDRQRFRSKPAALVVGSRSLGTRVRGDRGGSRPPLRHADHQRRLMGSGSSRRSRRLANLVVQVAVLRSTRRASSSA